MHLGCSEPGGKKGKLFIGGELLSDDDEAKEIELTPGEHLFEVEYRTTGGANTLKFHYAGPETSPAQPLHSWLHSARKEGRAGRMCRLCFRRQPIVVLAV